MEGLKNIERGNIPDLREKENPIEDLVKEYVFLGKKVINVSSLASKEGQGAIYGPGRRAIKNEAELCNCKKNVEEHLLLIKPEEIPRYFSSIKGEYCKNFAAALIESTENNLPPARRSVKNRTIFDEGTGNIAADASKKAEKSFDEMEKGMMREITINRILNAILSLKAETASSDLDIKNKIDIIAYLNKIGETDKIIIAVQVKGNQGEYNGKNGEAIEEVSVDTNNAKKKEFFDGCENFEKKLNMKEPDAKVIKIWVNVSDGDITSEGAGYKNELKAEIEYALSKILEKHRS